jgi:hypothetical protein
MPSLHRVAIGLALVASFNGIDGNARHALAAPITHDGRELARKLDSLGVESHWPAGVHVDWRTGIPDGKPEKTEGKHTHCSAFVASAAEQLGIYILRPPEHSQVLLANAQYDWLASKEGAKKGWHRLNGPDEAQQAANRGELVVATYHNLHDDKPGHIAIIRPADKPHKDIAVEGPQVTQAGGHNYSSAPLKQGFAGHPAAWKNNEILYYAHAVDEGGWHRGGRHHGK